MMALALVDACKKGVLDPVKGVQGSKFGRFVGGTNAT
jgi:hypothetical protein